MHPFGDDFMTTCCFCGLKNLNKVKKFLNPFTNELNNNNVRFKIDERLTVTPGYKFNEWEMKGVPIRVEVGPRDMENKSIMCARRDTNEKISYELKNATTILSSLLNEIQNNMYDQI